MRKRTQHDVLHILVTLFFGAKFSSSDFYQTQSNGKGAKHFKLTIHSPLRAQSRFVQDHSRLLPMRSSGFSNGLPRGRILLGLSFLISFSWLVSSKSTSLSSASFEAHSTFAFLFIFRFLAFLCLVLVPILHGVQLWSFDYLKNCLAEGRANPRQPAVARIFCFTTFVVSMKVRKNTFSMCSQGKLVRAFPKNSSREICRESWPYHFLGPHFFLQISNFY